MSDAPPSTPRLRRGQFLGHVACDRASHDIALSEIRYEPNVQLPRHGHESAYLSFVLGGEYAERVGTRTWPCTVNTLRFHPAGEEHSDEFGAAGGVCLNIELSPQWLHQMGSGQMLESLATDECAVAALHLRRALSHHDANVSMIVEELVLTLLAGCDRVSTINRASAGVPWLSRVVDYVESHLERSFTLSEVAAVAGVHPTHLARTFRVRTRGTMGDYVRRRRVARAQAELRTRAERSLSRLAYDVGFADHAHLSRTFKAITGLSPRQFRDLA